MNDDVTRPYQAPGNTPPERAGSGSGNALPAGTRLGEFELLSVAGEGGFSIVYRAWDHSLQRPVALKEYLPHGIAGRADGLQVRVKSIRNQETFEAGLQSFVKEAQMLARFDHPSLVKVFRFWEANGAAYMVMPFYEGRTLRDELRQRGGAPLDEATLLGWLGPVADALAVIHHAHWYHRDVAPDNVMLLAGSGQPLLLDFGAARQVIGDRTQALTVILKPGFAPLEQYGDIPGMRQGPWTDVYQLAAVGYYALTGRIPPAAVGRMLNDSFVPLTQLADGLMSRHVLEALDHALAVRPEARSQDIAQFKDELGLPPPPPPPAGSFTAHMPPPSAAAATVRPPAGSGALPPTALDLGAAPSARPAPSDPLASTTMAPRHRPAAPLAELPDPDITLVDEPAARAEARVPVAGAPVAPVAAVAQGSAPAADGGQRAPRAPRWLAAAAVLVLAGGGAAWWALRSPPPAAPVAAVAPAPGAAATQAPVPTRVDPVPAPAATATVATAPVAASAATPAPAAPASPAAAFDAPAEFAHVLQARTPGWSANLSIERPALRMDRDQLRFTLHSDQDGYVTVFHYGTDGQLLQLYPNRHVQAPRISRGVPLKLPAAPVVFNVSGPPGVSQLLAVVSRFPRDLSALAPKDLDGYLAFAPDAAALRRSQAANQAAGHALPPLAGLPRCGKPPCDDAFGAVLASYDVLP